MKILLLQPPENLERMLGKGKHFVMPIPPVGLMSLASYLEKYRYDIRILDAYFLKYNIEETVRQIILAEPTILGISCLTSNAANVFHIARLVKQQRPGIKIILGNVHASYFASFYIRKAGVDFVVHGEGEEAMLLLVKAIEAKKKDFASIPNLTWRAGEEAVENRREHAKGSKLDEYPWPARHLIPFSRYVEGVYAESNVRDTDMVFSSRGCVNRCTFCCIGFQHEFRLRNHIDVVDEIEYIMREYNIKTLTFGDSLFMASREHVSGICEELIRRKISIPWFCEGHAKYAEAEILALMKQAGCADVAYGIETGTPRIMKEIRKNTTLDEVARAVELTRKAKIRVSGLFMLGFPGETENEMMQTIKFATGISLDRAQFAITVPYPGSPLYDQLIKEKKLHIADEDDPQFVEDWYRYSAYISYTKENPIWCPESMSPERLKQIQKLALRKFYLRPQQIINEYRRVSLSNLKHAKSLLSAVKDTFF